MCIVLLHNVSHSRRVLTKSSFFFFNKKFIHRYIIGSKTRLHPSYRWPIDVIAGTPNV